MEVRKGESLDKKPPDQAFLRPGESEAAVIKTGEILALAGMAVLLLNNLGRRQVKQGRVSPRGILGRFLSYGDFVALGIILAGLVVIYLQK
jgi:hypothetical protein